MGLITLDISAKANQRPNSSGWLSVDIDNGLTHTFTLANFTTETSPAYGDPEGDPLESIKILTTPVKGVMKLSTVAITAPQIVTSAQLIAGDLVYESDVLELTGYNDSYMYFSVSDTGSSLFTAKGFPVTLKVATSLNLAPSAVGDGETTVGVGSTTIITTAMLTTGLNPPYQDPEGDAASMLLIETLPVYGDLFLNGVKVYVNQEISFTDITSGLFTYVNISLEDKGDVEGFNFKISDSGSGNYRG
jgi:hypothetical protein